MQQSSESNVQVDHLSEVPTDSRIASDLDGLDTAPSKLSFVEYQFDPTESEQILSLAWSLGAEPLEVFYGAFQVILAKYTASQHANTTFRLDMGAAAPPLDGIPRSDAAWFDLHTRIAHDAQFEYVISRTRSQIKQWQQASIQSDGSHAVHAHRSANWFCWNASIRDSEVESKTVSDSANDGCSHAVDLELQCSKPSNHFHIRMFYNATLFSASRMEVFVEQLHGLLLDLRDNLHSKLGDIRLRSRFDHLLPDILTPLPDVTNTKRIFDAFLANANRQPEAVAVRFGSKIWTYADLERASQSVASALLSQNCGPGRIVAVLASRGPALVISILGALRAGAAFAVLDAAYPVKRVVQCAQVLSPDFLIVCGGAEAPTEVLQRLPAPVNVIKVVDNYFGEKDSQGAFMAQAGAEQANPAGVAYFLFTSGTTGTPKCVETNHHPLVHFLDWYIAKFSLRANDKFSMLSGLGHDPVLRDIFAPLSVGAELNIPSSDIMFDAPALYDWLSRSAVSVVHATPQLCKLIKMGCRRGTTLNCIRFLFCGGDCLRTNDAQDFLGFAPCSQIVNFYGATETPQAMGFHVFDPSDHQIAVPVGVGIDDAQLLVTTKSLMQLGIGEVGQLAVRTKYLSLGYRGEAIGGNDTFSRNRTVDDPADHVYFTGDYGYFRPDGSIAFKGRIDDQVKIRGFRVELSEVAKCLEQQPGVKSAVVLARPVASGERRIAAYLLPDGSTSVIRNIDALHGLLNLKLPNYMVPSFYIWMDDFPLSPNGRINRGALPVPTIENTPNRTDYVPPASDEESRIIAAWERLLSIRPISVTSDFLGLGADSLSFIQASLVVEKLVGWLPHQWESLSIRDLAAQTGIGNKSLARVNTSVFVRALSIVLVVAAHFDLLDIGGSVLGLYLVAGMSFGKYQLNAIKKSDSLVSVYRLMYKIALPTFLYTVFLELRYSSFQAENLLFYSNFISPDIDRGLSYYRSACGSNRI